MTDTLTKGKIFKEDLALWTGSTEYVRSRRTSTGGSQSLTLLDWVGVDAYAAFGTELGRTGAAIANAIALSGSALMTIFLGAGQWTISTSLTIPETVCLKIAPGATVSIDASIVLTINGQVEAGRNQIFTGSGSVFVTGYTGHVIMEYWFNGATMIGTVPATCFYLLSAGGIGFGSSVLTATIAEINLTCDGNTATAAEITSVCDGNTATAAEITSVCDGNTATAAEIVKAADGIGVTIPRQKVIVIGSWNMDADATNDVAHGLTASKIVGVRGVIVEDSAINYYPLCGNEGGSATGLSAQIQNFDATNIRLDRLTGGLFDTTAFDSTAGSRGWLIVDYID